MMLRST